VDNRGALADLADIGPDVGALDAGVGLIVAGIVQIGHTGAGGDAHLSNTVVVGDSAVAVLSISGVVDEVELIRSAGADGGGLRTSLGGGSLAGLNSAVVLGDLREVVHEHGDVLDAPDASGVVDHVGAGLSADDSNAAGGGV